MIRSLLGAIKKLVVPGNRHQTPVSPTRVQINSRTQQDATHFESNVLRVGKKYILDPETMLAKDCQDKKPIRGI